MTIIEFLAKINEEIEKTHYDGEATEHFEWQHDTVWGWYTGLRLLRNKECIAVLEVMTDEIEQPTREKQIVAFQPWMPMTLQEFYFIKNECAIPVSGMNRWWIR